MPREREEIEGDSDTLEPESRVSPEANVDRHVTSRARTESTPSSLISLPKAGGSIPGLGEAFSPDLFSGTESVTIPLATSPGRGGFGPQLLLTYSVANSNGPFGLGFSLNVPSVRRDTRRRIPRYGLDDSFVLGGSDLVRDDRYPEERREGYRVARYRHRYEREFPRIELWTHDILDSGSAVGLSRSFWRMTDRNNITTFFGATLDATVADPNNDEHIAIWHLELTVDGKGNIIQYTYKPDDDAGLDVDDTIRARSQTYPKSIRYGNLTPKFISKPSVALAFLSQESTRSDWFFHVVFDYGEHKRLRDGNSVITTDMHQEATQWNLRPDRFFSCRTGFEIPTNRLCERVLMFHQMHNRPQPILVASTDLTYQPLEHSGVMTLRRVVKRGYNKVAGGRTCYSEDFEPDNNGSGLGVTSLDYAIASVPPLDFEYSNFEIRDRPVKIKGRGEEPRLGLGDGNLALVDVLGRGIPDVVESTVDGYFYWRNRGTSAARTAKSWKEREQIANEPVDFDAKVKLPSAPSGVILSDGDIGFADVDGNGQVDLLKIDNLNRLVYAEALTSVTGDRSAAGWQKDFRRFDNRDLPEGFRLGDINLRFLDLTGDGRLDALLARPDMPFVVFESKGTLGFVRSSDVGPSPDVSFSDPLVWLADMNGDGLKDIVQIETLAGSKQRVHYWPNLGYGSFGDRVTISRDLNILGFQAEYVTFVDIDGSGPADLVYYRPGHIDIWFNRSGTRWSDSQPIDGLPDFDETPTFVDLLGEGITGALWSRRGGFNQYQYLPLAWTKPALLTCIDNNMGRRTRYQYTPSTEFNLIADEEQDGDREQEVSEQQGHPRRIGRMPFPVFVLTRVERYDDVAGSRLVSEFQYAHGHYDAQEKEFVGFGRVEKVDTESFASQRIHQSGSEIISADVYAPPTWTKYWFHTGVHIEPFTVSRHLAREYYNLDARAPILSDSELTGMIGDDQRIAIRSLKGRPLRKEVFALDGNEKERDHPYQVVEFNYCVEKLQGKHGDEWAVFHTQDFETIETRYERYPDDPRTTHHITLAVDDFGHVTQSMNVAYPRRPGVERKRVLDKSWNGLPVEQTQPLITYKTKSYAQRAGEADGFRHGALYEEKMYQVTGINADANALLDISLLRE